MSISSRISAMQEHLRDDYSVLTLAGADLTNVDKNILNLKSTWQERLLYFMNNGTDVVWNNWDKVTGEGTSISLNNTLEGKMKINLKGNTSQEGTPTPETPQDIHTVSGDNSIEVVGKNLFDGTGWRLVQSGNGFPQPSTGATIVSSDENNISFTSTQWAYAGVESGFIKVKANETYMLSAKFTTPTNRFFITQYDENKTRISTLNYINVSTLQNTSFTTTNDGYIAIAFTNTTPAQTTYKIEDIQIEKGSTATTYEPYKGASYPINLGDIELCKIGDYQDKIDKSSDKNLFDDTTITSGKFVNQYGNMGTDATAFVSDYIEITPNIDYYISGRTTWNSVGLYDSSKTFIERPNYTATGILNITNTNVKYIRINASLSDINTLMLNEGTTALPYEPYGTGWYVKKEISKKSNLSSYYRDLTTNYNNLQYIRINKMTDSANYGNSNNIPVVFTHGIYQVITVFDQAVNIGRITSSGGYPYFYFGVDKTTTIEQAQTLLSNATIYYPLATPTYTEITDSTLLSQLETVKRSYEGQTNISQNNNDLPFIINATALKEMA